MVTESVVGQNLCRSCGLGFEARIPSLIICPLCGVRREQVKRRLTVIIPISAAAKRLELAVSEALSNRKFVAAEEHLRQLRDQIDADCLEAEARKLRKKAKSESWASRQAERRVIDQSIRSKMRGK